MPCELWGEVGQIVGEIWPADFGTVNGQQVTSTRTWISYMENFDEMVDSAGYGEISPNQISKLRL